jgi:hypothetical protein
MIKLNVLLLSLCIISSEVSASRTIVDQEFYGTWSTISSILQPKRQILELDSFGGRWISITDQGEKKVRKLNKSDISIKEDLLIIDYKKKDKDLRLKLVLAGWGSNDHKNIFGTVYLYRDHGNGLNLINGMPMSFESGTQNMPPQQFWSFFSGREIEKVEAGYIHKIEKGLKDIEGVIITESENSTDYSLENTKQIISITKKGKISYPSAIGLRPSSNFSERFITSGIFEGDDKEFKDFYDSYLADLETLNKETKEEMQKLFEKIEEHKSEK